MAVVWRGPSSWSRASSYTGASTAPSICGARGTMSRSTHTSVKNSAKQSQPHATSTKNSSSSTSFTSHSAPSARSIWEIIAVDSMCQMSNLRIFIKHWKRNSITEKALWTPFSGPWISRSVHSRCISWASNFSARSTVVSGRILHLLPLNVRRRTSRTWTTNR